MSVRNGDRARANKTNRKRQVRRAEIKLFKLTFKAAEGKAGAEPKAANVPAVSPS